MLRQLPYWLFAAALLLGRWQFVLHDAEHWQPKASADACQLCLHHSSQDQAAAPALVFALAPIAAAAPQLAPRPALLLRSPRYYRSRAPPVLSA